MRYTLQKEKRISYDILTLTGRKVGFTMRAKKLWYVWEEELISGQGHESKEDALEAFEKYIDGKASVKIVSK